MAIGCRTVPSLPCAKLCEKPLWRRVVKQLKASKLEKQKVEVFFHIVTTYIQYQHTSSISSISHMCGVAQNLQPCIWPWKKLDGPNPPLTCRWFDFFPKSNDFTSLGGWMFHLPCHRTSHSQLRGAKDAVPGIDWSKAKTLPGTPEGTIRHQHLVKMELVKTVRITVQTYCVCLVWWFPFYLTIYIICE